MKIFVLNTPINGNIQGNPDIMQKNCLVISPHNKSFLKSGNNNFLVTRFYKDHETFNTEKSKELAVFRDIDSVIEYANYLNEREINIVRL